MLRSLIFAAVFYVTTALFLLLGSWLFFAPRSWAMAGLKAHALTCVWLLEKICGTRMEVRGREKLPKGPYLVVAKHQSAWDTFALIPLFRDPAIVLKDELKWIPFYGWFCVKFEHILVKRDKGASALKAMIRDARARAAEGREVVIFPEGTRQAPGAPPDYKPGYVALYEGLGLALRAARVELRPLLAAPQPHALPRHHRRRVPRPDPARPAARGVPRDFESRHRGGDCAADRRGSKANSAEPCTCRRVVHRLARAGTRANMAEQLMTALNHVASCHCEC